MKENSFHVDFLSGFIGGLTSITVTTPLELCKIRMNAVHGNITNIDKNNYKGLWTTMKYVFQQEGFLGFYKGFTPVLVVYPIFHGLYFSIYNYLKVYCRKNIVNQEFKANLLSSLSAGMICDIITNPLWVIFGVLIQVTKNSHANLIAAPPYQNYYYELNSYTYI